ncbi:MAG: signal peptide peptidase SppA [Deltaproteobacteria bacterium]|nr:signal peptide peptidase SppA [Deltaproteobacteria bacterium]
MLGLVAILVLILSGVVYIFGDTKERARGSSIGVIEIKGIILKAEPVLRTLVQFRNDKNIKAIILRVDSSGGGVAPTQEIYREIMRTRSQKKVIASLGNIAASGGIYIASAANYILANPGTLTGSVSVIMHFTNYEDLFEKVGLKSISITSGEFKDIGSPTRGMTEKEKRILQRLVDQIHQQFVNDLAKARGLPLEKINALADGQIFSGEEAVELGLVDKLGNFEDAIAYAQKVTGLTERPKLVYPKKKKSWFLDILTGESQVNFFPDRFSHPFRLEYVYAPVR